MSGEANFSTEKMSLIIGGFNQPYVSCSLIEQPGNVEKGERERERIKPLVYEGYTHIIPLTYLVRKAHPWI